MAYLKDVKLCVDCTFYGNPYGQRDRCVNPKTTIISLVTGEEDFPTALQNVKGRAKTTAVHGLSSST
jgi:hypothetical protein